jgi:hypothetical protein
MKAISLWQPWASLIAAGLKPYETRNWAPAPSMIGQTIAIHAAKKIDRDAIDFAEELFYGRHADQIASTYDEAPDELMGLFGQVVLPIGCIVAALGSKRRKR